MVQQNKHQREPGWWMVLPFEIVGRVVGVVAMLLVWCTLGLFVCMLIAFRSLLWTTGKNILLGFMDRPPVSHATFNHWMLLWPRKLVEYIRWGFGYVEDERPAARGPWELVQETFAVTFFFVTLIWANEVKPGYLPDVIAMWSWLWQHVSSTLGAGLEILMGLIGYRR